MAEHTATPWTISGGMQGNGARLIMAHEHSGAEYTVATATLPPFGDREQLRENNAEFIVRAVNSHEALVSALREALDYIGCNSGGAVQDQMRAALKLAKGGQV